MFKLAKRNLITVVNQGEICYREFLGTNRVKLEPGLRINLPILHKIQRVDMRETGNEIKNIKAFTQDNVPVIIGGTLFHKVFDPELACFSVENYKSSVLAIGESATRSIIGRFEYDLIIRERNALNKELINVIGDSIKQWGIDCTRFEIQEFNPQNQEVRKQLEQQMEQERKRRANELETLTKIRTAEGLKQEAVLVSEGQSISLKNLADAEKYAVEIKTLALSNQINTLKEILETNENVVNYLLETKRIEEFGKIASSTNKEIFFVNPKGLIPTSKIIGDTTFNKA